MTPEYIALKNQVEKQRKVVRRKLALAEAQQVILREMLTKCPHEEIEARSTYYEGDYYNKAYTTHWNQCTLCFERSEEERTNHNYYG